VNDLPTTPAPQEDARLIHARDVLRGCPASPYSPGVSAAERALWCERTASALRDVLGRLAEQDGDPE